MRMKLDNPTFTCLDREEQIRQATNTFYDLIVIGGGVTGAGIALDASHRGFRTLLVEKGDFASGTSSKSTKLIHGGLRYLKQFEIGLVRETGTERAVVHELAPHLVHPEKMLLPIVEDGSFGKWSASIAISIYDYLAGVKSEDRKIGLDNDELLADEPLLKPEGLKGGVKYSEYRTDDSRLTISLVKAAVSQGATAFNYAEVTDLLYVEDRVAGVTCVDHISGQKQVFKGSYVVSAAGPWVDKIRGKDNSLGGKSLHLTKGVHIVLDYQKLPIRNAVYFDAFDGRMIFAIPRGKVTYVGTSDTTYQGDLDRVLCTKEDANYLLNAINNYFVVEKVTVSDICSSWAGLRPLIHEDGKSPSELSRKDEIFESSSGLVSIAGGKLTGYRKMAERIVDLFCAKDPDRFPAKCGTASLKLQNPSYQDYHEVKQDISDLEVRVQKLGLKPHHAWYLITTYGKDHEVIVKQMEALREIDDPELELVRLEVAYTIGHESIYHPQDFFNRRTGRIYFDIESVRKYQKEVIGILAGHFGWDQQQCESEEKENTQMLTDCLAFIDQED